MANPVSISVTSLSANSGVRQPFPGVFDSNGMIGIAVEGNLDRVILEIINADDADLTATIKAGNPPPGIVSHDLPIILGAAGGDTAKQIIGPFDSARWFVQEDGMVYVDLLAATGNPAGTIRAYRFPKI
jgi:hypothetical protein